MQITPIQNTNFGLKFSERMENLLDISLDIVVEQGKEETAKWDKTLKEIKKIFPDKYILNTTYGIMSNGNFLTPVCMSLETPLGKEAYSIKGEDIFELDKNKTILDNENLEKLKAKLLEIKARTLTKPQKQK